MNCWVNKMKKAWAVVFLVLLLIVADQSAKFYITNTFEADDKALDQVEDTVHIHHKINYENPNLWAEYAETIGLSVRFWKWVDIFEALILPLLILCVLFAVYRYSVFAKMKNRSFLVSSSVVFIGAGSACGIIDRAFWECTHDFICISKGFVNSSGKPVIGHLTADVKDYYLDIAVVLIIIWGILFCVEYSKLPNKKESLTAFLKKLKTKRKVAGIEIAEKPQT